jgi:hypothetical protein
VTDLEHRAILALRDVRMPSQGWHWRRAEYLYFKMTQFPSARLVETQQVDLWFLVWRYRRQIIDKEIVAHAEYLVNGAAQLAFDKASPQGD